MSIQDEFDFIKKINPSKTFQPGLIAGIGDDSAIFDCTSNTEQIVCIDTMVEGVHFTLQTMSPFQIGYKALAVNISDIAAMGGVPTYYLVSIAIPKNWSESDLLLIYDGMAKMGNRYNMDLIGGDTVSTSGGLTITVTVLGEIKKGKHLLRRNAKPGDIVFVSGTLGDSAAGLELLLQYGVQFTFEEHLDFLVKRHQYPQPRIEIGKILSTFSRVALNDVSDGIASEANEIAEASQVQIVLDADAIPISQQLAQYHPDKALERALYGGEDYELIGTVSRQDWLELKGYVMNKVGSLQKIGHVLNDEPGVLLNDKGIMHRMNKRGFNHFAK